MTMMQKADKITALAALILFGLINFRMELAMKKVFLTLWFLAAACAAQAQFIFVTNNDAITITQYTGTGGNVTIPSSTNGYPVTCVGSNAFEGCSSLTGVTIPNSVTNIGVNAFYYCESLTNIAVCALNPAYAGVGGVLFDASLTTLVQYPIGWPQSSYVVPNSVTNVGDYAFALCTNLTSVTIPNSVAAIGVFTFFYCFNLSNAILGNHLTTIDEGAFQYCTSLTSVTIPDSVTTMAEQAFAGCYGLTTMTIPYSVTNVGDYAFGWCYSLASVTIGGSVTNNGVTTIGQDAFFYCYSLTNVIFGESVTGIGDDAFDSCTGLRSVTNPYSVTAIGEDAFANCSGLTSVTISDSVTTIGGGAFISSGLTSVTIPASVTTIGANAFIASGLKAAYFQGNAPLVNGGPDVFNPGSGVVFYVPGTSGWGASYGGWPTAWWYQPEPQILGSGCGLGVKNNQFNLTVSWGTNTSVLIEACTNLCNPVWVPLTTNALVNGTNCFSDLCWTNFPSRFYRVALP
jgi:hypothetical protein